MKHFRKLTAKFITATCIIGVCCILTTCCRVEEKEPNIFLHNEKDAIQTAFADDETSGSFTFTAKNNWTTVMTEIIKLNKSDDSWIKLFCDETEIYSGSAGTFTMKTSLELNRTEKPRTAKIEILCVDEIIAITVTQSATTKEGELPEPEPLVIDLTYAVPDGLDIATLKIFNCCSFTELLISTEVSQSGYIITVPNPEKVLTKLEKISWDYDLNVSDPEARYATTGFGTQAYDSNGKLLGYFNLLSEEDKTWEAWHWYVDRDCSVSGTFGHIQLNHVNCSFKRGWNVVYIETNRKPPHYSLRWIWTTEKPVGENFVWVFR